MTDHQLIKLARKSGLHDIDESILRGQGKAFDLCRELLSTVTTRKTINPRFHSYNLKHIVENPSGRFGTEQSCECYSTYVYEGTLILAALSLGFECQQHPRGLTACFNMDTKSLKEAARRVTATRTPEPSFPCNPVPQ